MGTDLQIYTIDELMTRLNVTKNFDGRANPAACAADGELTVISEEMVDGSSGFMLPSASGFMQGSGTGFMAS